MNSSAKGADPLDIFELPTEGNVLPLVGVLPAEGLCPLELYRAFASPSTPSCLVSTPHYTFIGLSPVEIIRVQQGRVILSGPNVRGRVLKTDPVAFLKQHLYAWRWWGVPPHLPPLLGGYIGFFAYDFVSCLQSIPTNALAYACPDAYLMQFRELFILDHLRQQIFVSCVLSKSSRHCVGEARLRRAKGRLVARLETLRRLPRLDSCPLKPAAFSLPKPGRLHVRLGQKSYKAKFDQIQQHIRQGDIFQCVLSEQFNFQVHSEPFELFAALYPHSQAPYRFFLKTEEGAVLGLSPERLLKCEQGKLESCPMAGTRPAGKTEAERERHGQSLQSSLKERAEHTMLVDLSRNDLGKVCQAGSLRVDPFSQTAVFGPVQHLLSVVSGTLARDKSPLDAFLATFPAGTLTGAPKIRAMEIIAQLENISRGVYGGAVFLHDFGAYLDSCITIRSLYIQENRAWLSCGGGIVAHSRAQDEYQEIEHKASTITGFWNCP